MNNSTFHMTLTSAQAISLASYRFFVILVGLTGNFLVLYGSMKHNAIKMDKVSLSFIQNLALADILYILITVLPEFVVTCAGVWVFGPVLCNVGALAKYIPLIGNSMFVLTITIQRLVLFTYPLKSLSPGAAKICCYVIWAAIVTFIVCLAAVYRPCGVFQPSNGFCSTSIFLTNDDVFLFATIFAVSLPLGLILITNIAICVVANKHSTGCKQRRSNFLLVTLISGVYLLSWIPGICKNMSGSDSDILLQLSSICLTTGSWFNPMLYTATNRRFRRYWLKQLGRIINGTLFQTTTVNPAPVSSTNVVTATGSSPRR